MMGATRRGILVIVVTAFALAMAGRAATAQAKVDVTGTWIFDVTTDAGTGTPTVTLKQDGEKLAGHYSSSNLGEADLTGTVKGQNIAFTFVANVQGTALDVSDTGTIESKDAMKGTLSITAIGNGTFTAKRK
jgi:hypothetical protein